MRNHTTLTEFKGHQPRRPETLEPTDQTFLLLKVAALVEEERRLLGGNLEGDAYHALTKEQQWHLDLIRQEREGLWHRIRQQRAVSDFPAWLRGGGIVIDLIFCAGGNPRLMDSAISIGWLPGARSDHWSHVPIRFVDIDYKRPQWEKHLARVMKEQPKYATVPDLREDCFDAADIARAIRQAEELANWCEIPLIVPKLSGQIALIPEQIALGYSVPSTYGGAKYPAWELAGRRIHLLGGSPKKQYEAASYLAGIATVMSADGNYATLMAKRYMEFWTGKTWQHWPHWNRDEYYACCEASLRNIYRMWHPLDAERSV